MHILLIHQAFVALDEPGGTRHYELARYLVEHGHRVTVITSPVSYLTGRMVKGNARVEYTAEKGEMVILRTYTYPAFHQSFVHRTISFFSFMISSFFTSFRVRKPDLVWGTSPPIFQGVTAWLLARIKGVPFFFEVRDLWPAFAIDVGVLRNRYLIHLSEWLEKFLYRRAFIVVVNSPGFVTHVERRGARRVELVPNGADLEMFDPFATGEGFRRVNRLVGKFVALYAGAHGMSNDLEVILQAAQLLAKRPDVVFVLLGDGKEKPGLIAQASRMGLTNVLFLPPVPKLEMKEALAAADACIAILKPIPMYATVFPNKVFDYLAAGRPVVLAIDGVIRELVEKAGAGIFTPPGDPQALAQAICHLADHPNERIEMGRRARQCVESQYNRRVLADKLMRIFQESRP